MKLNNREIEGIIFDLDGTLLDSLDVWGNVDKLFFERRGMKVPENYAMSIAHLGFVATAEYTKNKYQIKESVEEIIKEWTSDVYLGYKEQVLIRPGVRDFLDKCAKNKVKMMVITACNKDLFIPCLQRNGIYEYFEHFITVEDTGLSKDTPMIYQKGINYLKIKPQNIAVIEDISLGIQNAQKLGCFGIGIYEHHSESENKKKKQISDLYIESFNDLL